MKSFKKMISEVAQPKPEEEKRFKAQHTYEITPHPVALPHQHTGEFESAANPIAKPKAARPADQQGDANYDLAYESALDRVVTEALKGGQKKLDHNKNGKLDAHDFVLMRAKKMKEEAEQLDELSPNTLHSYVKKASSNLTGRAATAAIDGYTSKKDVAAKDNNRKVGKRLSGISSASGRLADKANSVDEEVEQIDELSKKTLGSYIKKAKTDVAGQAYQLGAKDPLKPKASWSKALGREKHIDKAVDRLTKEEVELDEEVFAMDIDYNQEKRLATAAKAAGLAIKFVQAGGATEMQLRGDKDKITKFLKARRVPASEISSGWFNEEVELDEAAPKMKGDSIKIQREKDRAHDAAMGRTPTGRKKPVRQMTSTQRSLASMRNEEAEQIDEVSQKTLWNYHAKAGADLQKKREKLDKGTLTMKDLKKGQNRVKGLNRAADKMHEEVESLDEAFKQGIVKLKDGSQTILKKEDADLLNQMFKDLSSNNRKKMEEVAMKDKSGFAEILGFAREAL